MLDISIMRWYDCVAQDFTTIIFAESNGVGAVDDGRKREVGSDATFGLCASMAYLKISELYCNLAYLLAEYGTA
jgi:hypothetical protein